MDVKFFSFAQSIKIKVLVAVNNSIAIRVLNKRISANDVHFIGVIDPILVGINC